MIMNVVLDRVLNTVYLYNYVFFFKQKTAYEMRISDWSSDVCSSDLFYAGQVLAELVAGTGQRIAEYWLDVGPDQSKLGADVFIRMLDELYAFDPELLLGTEAAQASIGVSGEVASPLLAYARLRRYGEEIGRAHV